MSHLTTTTTVRIALIAMLALLLAQWWLARREEYSTQATPATPAATSAGPAGRRRVCVLMFSTPNIVDEYAGIAARVNEAYAQRHGYDFKHVVGRSRHAIPQWEKVRLVRAHMASYDVVFWIDSDAVFNQHERSLDEWINDPADFVGCTDVPNGPYKINCGTLLVKTTPWTKKFVDAWWAKNGLPKYNTWANEQEALHDMITSDEQGCASARKVKIEAVDAFNSDRNQLVAGARDTFVLHFMAMTSDERRRELGAVAKKLGV